MEINAAEISNDPNPPSSLSGGGRDLPAGEELLPLFRQIIGERVSSAKIEAVKTSASPAAVFRARLRYNGTAAGPDSLILKRVLPEWPGDPYGPDREACFYSALQPRIGLQFPQLYYSGCDPESRIRLVVLEDLQGYRYRNRTECWTMEEARCFIRSYARLHTCTIAVDDPHRAWLFPITASRLSPKAVIKQYEALVSLGIWNPLPGLESLMDRVLAAAAQIETGDEPLLHNDVFPPNIGLPPDLSEQAVLIDWEMAGYGPGELDLAYMFLQPFGSARHLDRRALLADYWARRYQMEGRIPPSEERANRQFYADALWGLWLVPVAHRSVVRPFPSDSAPHQFWQAMRGVLHAWLARLAASPAHG